jgi:aryl-phospho-beta-D-glucosidase BglC (GH1 family)
MAENTNSRQRGGSSFRFLSGILLSCACLLLVPHSVRAQLPTPTYGWNLGNTLEATWTNSPSTSQAIINAVASAGFNTIRIPCAWDHNADPTTHQISASYMATVTQAVQWAQSAGLTVVINEHWDNGWFEDSNFNSFDSNVNAKLVSYWTQIANNFRNYNSGLLFAVANEPNVTTQAQSTILFQYYQNFINAVRNTGGNNSTRWLVLQGPGVSIDNTASWVTTMPSDPARHLALEVHYYTPYQYALMPVDETWGNTWYFWGQNYHSSTLTSRNANNWEESYVVSQFQKMQTQFTSKGIPVFVGEFGAIRRSSTAGLTGTDLSLHLASRTYFDRYLVTQANNYGLKPCYWDDGDNGTGNNTFGIFDRSTGALTRPDDAHALTGGAALPPPGGGGIIANGVYKIICRNGGLALEVSGLGTANGSNVDQWGYWGGVNQKWTLTHLGNNVYTITGVQSGRALDVYNWGTANGTNVDIWDSGGGVNQQWKISATSNGYYRVTPMNATGSCLDVNGVSTSNGANVQIWQYVGGNNQQWSFQAP